MLIYNKCGCQKLVEVGKKMISRKLCLWDVKLNGFSSFHREGEETLVEVTLISDTWLYEISFEICAIWSALLVTKNHLHQVLMCGCSRIDSILSPPNY